MIISLRNQDGTGEGKLATGFIDQAQASRLNQTSQRSWANAIQRDDIVFAATGRILSSCSEERVRQLGLNNREVGASVD